MDRVRDTRDLPPEIGVDGVLEIEQPDSNPLPPGGIWLEVLDQSVVLFDDVYVCEPSD